MVNFLKFCHGCKLKPMCLTRINPHPLWIKVVQRLICCFKLCTVKGVKNLLKFNVAYLYVTQPDDVLNGKHVIYTKVL